MKAAIIENGIVKNIVKVESQEFAESQGWIVSDIAKHGDSFIDGQFISPGPLPIAETAPEFVSKGQARRWLIKQGIMPSMVAQEIAKIPDEIQRELAMSYWEDQTQYNRFNPLMIQIGAAFGFDTEEKLAQAFIEASQED